MSERLHERPLAIPSVDDPRGRRWRSVGIAVSMGWLAIPVVDLLGSAPPWWRAAIALVGLLAFSCLYILSALHTETTEPRERALVLLGLGGIATVLTVADRGSWALLFVYVAAACGVRLPSRAAARAVVVCAALAAGLSALTDPAEGQVVTLAATTLAIGFMMMSFGRLIRSNLELIAARAAVARLAVADERERFARDLHDLLGHSLSVIALKSELAGRLLPHQPNEAARHVAELEEVARDALAEVREAVSGYRQPTLAGELAGARLALEAAGIEARVKMAKTPLPPDVEAVLAWAVREGTTNVIRHSRAQHCTIAVIPGSSDATAEILDDGGGGRNGGGATGLDAGERHGLAGLRERAAQLAGQVEAGTRPEGGFRLRVTVPLLTAEGTA